MTRMMLAGLTVMGLLACGASKPEPVPARGEPVSTDQRIRRLTTGATIETTLDRTITSRSTRATETVTATVVNDVSDARGRVVIPSGSAVELTVTDIQPARNRSQADGRLTLEVTGVTIRGDRYPIEAEVIGGAVGAAGGTVVAIQTASRDVVVAAGTPVSIILTRPLSVPLK